VLASTSQGQNAARKALGGSESGATGWNRWGNAQIVGMDDPGHTTSKEWVRNRVSDALAGLIATGAMSWVMRIAQRRGWLGKPPPKKITQAAHDSLGLRRSRRSDDLLATLAHVGFGVACAEMFGVASRALRLRATLPVAGVVFGTTVWALSYWGWVPKLGIMPRPPHDRPGRPSVMVAAHWVYGGVLGALHATRPSALLFEA
jgi:hypothetical protein